MQKFLEKFKRKPLLFLLPSASVLLLLFLLFFHSQQDADQAFSKYTSELFRQEISGNTITLHYTLKNPEKYGIENAPISYGQCTTDPELVRSSVDAERTRLRSYNRTSLSKDNRLTYDVLNDYLNSAYDLSPYTLYDEPLAPLTGTQSQLPVILSEYRFYEISDIENYLQLLTKTPEYFRSILNFEHTKSESGLFMASYTADSIIKECWDFVHLKESNYLYSSFVERLDELASTKNSGLTEKQRKAYTRQNSAYIKKYIFPSYEQLISGLSELRNSGKNNNGLCYLPNGRTYYEYLVRSETGSSRSIAELQNLPAAISANAQKIAENAGLLQLYNENFLALKDEVGNKKVEILNQQFSNLNHRLESLEETKSTDALILSAVLLIKENALYNKNFAAEADILAQLAQGQDNIASAVQTIVSLKSLPIASNDELIKNYQQIAEEFTFAVSNEQLQENKEADDNAVAKSIALIKDTVAGINFDKVVVLKKDKRTDAQKQLMEQLASLVENHDFKNAVKFIRETPEFQKTQNPELTHWIEQAERRISFDEAVSYIIAAELNAIRQDFSNTENLPLSQK